MFGADKDTIYSMEYSVMITFIVAFAVIAPLSSLKEMSGFRYVSLVSLISLFYIMIVLYVELPGYAEKNFSYERLNYFKVDLKLL